MLICLFARNLETGDSFAVIVPFREAQKIAWEGVGAEVSSFAFLVSTFSKLPDRDCHVSSEVEAVFFPLPNLK